MKRWLFFAYGVGCHLFFLATYLYMACFVGNLWVPKSIDSAPAGSIAAALAINLFLLGLFAAQHSIMARPGFKDVWTKFIPRPIERSTYVFFSCVVTIVVMGLWRGMDAVVWNVEQPILRGALWCLFAVGWILVPAISMLIDHFDLFGTRQVWLYLKGREYQPLPFRTPLLYSHVRHPLYIGWAIAFWATPTMTVGHLLFASVLTVYMGLAARVEERDLIAHFGRRYEEYCRSVPMFLPRLGISSAKPSHPVSATQESETA